MNAEHMRSKVIHNWGTPEPYESVGSEFETVKTCEDYLADARSGDSP